MMDNEKIAMRVSRNSIYVNLLLSVGKLAAGVIGSSAAMVSDAVHSASDVFSTIIVMIGVKLSNRASDANHQYGHERLECVAAILLAVVLAATGLKIGYDGIELIVFRGGGEIEVPTLLPLVAAIISILAKEGMYWYTIRAAKKIKSGALKADAWHHRSDALSSVGSFIGILGARLGFPVLDPIAGLVICLFILKAAYDIFMDAVGKLTDEACDADMVQRMEECVRGRQGVLGIDDVKTRMFGNRIYVDIEIECDGESTLFEAHAVAEDVHDTIEREFEDVKHCMVHVNPYRPGTEEGNAE